MYCINVYANGLASKVRVKSKLVAGNVISGSTRFLDGRSYCMIMRFDGRLAIFGNLYQVER